MVVPVSLVVRANSRRIVYVQYLSVAVLVRWLRPVAVAGWLLASLAGKRARERMVRSLRGGALSCLQFTTRLLLLTRPPFCFFELNKSFYTKFDIRLIQLFDVFIFMCIR